MPFFEEAQYIPKLKAYFSTRSQFVLAYVFGSQAQGRAHRRSDLDVAVLLADEPADEECTEQRLEVIGDLMRLLATNEVDVLILNQSPLVMRYQVIRKGALIYYRQRQEAINFRVETLNLYFDFKPILDHHRQVFFQKIRQGKFLDGYNRYRGTLATTQEVASSSAGTSKAEL
jgi:predicted nucleotidyltransferase